MFSYYWQVDGYQWGGGISSTADRKLKEKWPGDYYAYTVNVVGEQFRVEPMRTFIMAADDALGRNVTLPYLGFGPDPYAVTLVGFGDGRIFAHRSIQTCGKFLTIPWSFDRNRPFFAADATLTGSARNQANTSAVLAAAAALGSALLLAAGLPTVWCGFADWEDHQAHRLRRMWIRRYVAGGLVALAALVGFAYVSIAGPRQALIDTQDYYAFYQSLPSQNAKLSPIGTTAMSRLLRGPPLPDAAVLHSQTYFAAVSICLVAWLVVFGKRMYMGLYWLLATLPLRRTVRRAQAAGRWPTAAELMGAFREATEDKADWKVRMMARKAIRFAAQLDRRAARLRG